MRDALAEGHGEPSPGGEARRLPAHERDELCPESAV